MTTATCSSTDKAIAPHSHGLANRAAEGARDSERALKQLNKLAKHEHGEARGARGCRRLAYPRSGRPAG